MNSDAAVQPRRPYRQTARAEATEATARRIVEAFGDCVRDRWFDDVTLEEVAARAGVTVRTVVRRFGGKAGLVAGFLQYVAPQIRAQRTAAPGDVEGAIDRVVALYEEIGDSVVRNLSQESRQPALKTLLEFGRREHRKITAETFAPWLDRLPSKERKRALDALVIATDVYTWKLLRRDMGRSAKNTKSATLSLVQAILDRYSASQQGRDTK
jgi:AcrR family transcriptional regulator